MPQTSTDSTFNPDVFESAAQQLAKQQLVTKHPRTSPLFLERPQQQEALLRTAYQRFANTPKVQIAPSSAAEWILDNYFLLQQTFRQIHENMPPGFYSRLPKLDAGPLAGYPRIYGIAHKIIEISRAQV